MLPSQTEDFFATEAFGDPEKGYEMYYFPQFTAHMQENIVAMQKEKEVESEDISAKTLENEIQQLQMILEKREQELAQTNMQWKRNIAEFSLEKNKLEEQLKGMLEERKQILEERSLFQKRLELSEGERGRLKKTVEHLERKCKEVEEAVRLEVAEKIN